ncbi:MAG: hypothetical protein IT308_03160 [Anaerolineaceae bacterium]|nr:hypothetical protein [Anaerolineaceae bacterium]
MGNRKLDGLVEAVRYGTDGEVAMVRMYERRGPTYSDWKLIGREELVKRLRKGQRIAAGKRIHNLASTFQVRYPIRLAGEKGAEKLITTQETPSTHDRLEGVPVF